MTKNINQLDEKFDDELALKEKIEKEIQEKQAFLAKLETEQESEPQEISLSQEEFDRIYNQILEETKDEVPFEWERSYGFFYSPIIFFCFSVFYLLATKMNMSMMILIIFINTALFVYNFLKYNNQRLLVYSTHFVYEYGILKSKEKVFIYGSEDLDEIHTPRKTGILKRVFKYGNVYFLNSQKRPFQIENVGEPELFSKFIEEKVETLNRRFDPNYKVRYKQISSTKEFLEEINQTK